MAEAAMSMPITTTSYNQPPIALRAPSTTSAASATSAQFTPPPIPWLEGTWFVTHSTLPMWKNSRNVAITYRALPPSSPSDPVRLDDVVNYQSHTSDKIKEIHGIDKPAGVGSWDWRGAGWLMIASSHWEVLGYGGGDDGSEQWVVTYFSKTLFTPAGVDIYSRKKEGLSQGTLDAVKRALANVDASDVRKLAGEVFTIKSDHY